MLSYGSVRSIQVYVFYIICVIKIAGLNSSQVLNLQHSVLKEFVVYSLRDRIQTQISR